MTFKSLYGCFSILLVFYMLVNWENAVLYGALAMIMMKIYREENN